MEKKRVIVDFRNITQELLRLLTDTYPYGYDDVVIKFQNSKGEWVKAVALEDENTRYLVKVGTEMDRKVEAFLDDDDEEESEDGDILDFDNEGGVLPGADND